jgi:hypothetical protein
MLLSDIGISIPFYDRGAGGIWTAAYTGMDLAARCDRYEQAISARGGFETMRTGFACDRHEAIVILNTWLGRSTKVKGPAMQTIWEGLLSEISITLGQRTRSVSLDPLANRVRCRYSVDQGGASVTTPVSDAASIAIYGTKDAVIAVGSTTAAAAANAASRALAQWRNPVQRPSTKIATGRMGDVSVDLLFRGWYSTLGWVLTSRTSTTLTATDSQIGTLIGTGGAGIGAVNNFLDTTTPYLESTGVTDTEFIAPETSYLDKIEKLVSLGDGADRWVLMCLEDRRLHFRRWAGATPATITYVADLGDHQIYTPQGALIPPWDVRPDAMYQELGMLDAAPSAAAYDTAATQYVERVICSIDSGGVGVTLEPAAQDSLDTLLAALGG